MEIIRQVREFIWWVVKQGLQFIAFVLWAALFPVVLVVLPIALIWNSPSGDYSLMGEVFFWAAPWSCAFYMALLVNYQSIRQWKREGRDAGVFAYKWRMAHGGIASTLIKSSVYMFGALFASYILGFFYLFAWNCVPLPQPAKLVVGFELFPLAAYAPVILLWVTRWMRGSEV